MSTKKNVLLVCVGRTKRHLRVYLTIFAIHLHKFWHSSMCMHCFSIPTIKEPIIIKELYLKQAFNSCLPWFLIYGH